MERVVIPKLELPILLELTMLFVLKKIPSVHVDES